MNPFNRLFVFAVLICGLLASCGAPATGTRGSSSAPAASAESNTSARPESIVRLPPETQAVHPP
jgi:hypothetical protein